MKFGIFYEHQLPRPWTERSEYELLQNSLAQIELADQLGYDHAWEVEHHFLEEYSHSSAPEVFLGAATQRTRRIRLGHGIIQLPTNHPLRVAERVATLDLLSGGRVELGLGEGQGPMELHPFGARVRDKREVWEEAVQALIPAFTRTSWEWRGKHFNFPARNVIPHPPRRSGHRGLPGLLAPERGHRPPHSRRAEAEDGREGGRASMSSAGRP
jgi:alkanesulfonate monooxygenase SsuD/methylene tetrahydromethanopterin reductase-like flavin-dependent oxidoreductase (luciferase family)